MSDFIDNVRAAMESFGCSFDEAAEYVRGFMDAYGGDEDEDGDIRVDED